MKKRFVKKMARRVLKSERKRMEKVQELVKLAMSINGPTARDQEKTGNKPTVFVEFYGHTAQLYIDIYKEGWALGMNGPKEHKSISLMACEQVFYQEYRDIKKWLYENKLLAYKR